MAEADAGVSRQELEAVKRSLLGAVKEAYAELYRIDRTREIVGEGRALLASYAETARLRYESGAGVLENVLRAQAESTRLEIELSALERERRAVEARLARLLGRRGPQAWGPARAALTVTVPDAAALEESAVASAPEVLTRRAAAARDEARVDLAKRDLKPDFTWSAAYQNRGGLDPMVMGGFGVRLPIYRGRKQEQAVAQAESELAASRADAETAAVGVAAEVRDLVARAETSRREALLYGEGLIPQSRSALDAAAAAYAAGRADFAALVDDLLALLDAERTLEAARAAEAAALAQLEPLTGATLVTAGQGERHE